MTENAAVVVGVDGSEGSLAALRWSALEAHRRQLPLRIVAAGGLDAVMPATASESFWRHLSAYQASWANDVVNDAADLARQTAPVEPQTAVHLTETAVIALQGEAESAGLLVVGSRGRGRHHPRRHHAQNDRTAIRRRDRGPSAWLLERNTTGRDHHA
jgi:nucleotide-binding universal stress UspA family protein